MITEFDSPAQAIEFYEAAVHKRMEALSRLSRGLLVAEMVEWAFDQDIEELSRHYTGTDDELAMEFYLLGAQIDECTEQLSRLRDVL